jgi:hypothetical protein
MARRFGTNAAYLNSPNKLTLGNATKQRAGVKVVDASFVTASDAIADDIVLGQELPGDQFLYGVIHPAAGLGGTATVALGIEGDTAKYAAAAIYNAATPSIVRKLGAIAPGVARKKILATVAAAALPAGTQVTVFLFFATADLN